MRGARRRAVRRWMALPEALKAAGIGLAVLVGLAVVLGLALSHHIGGFLRTVEREAREEEAQREREEAERANKTSPGD